MPRKLTMENAGAIYHVMNRENRRKNIFRGKTDRELFLAVLTEAFGKTGGRCMRVANFFDVVETSEPAS